MPDSCCVPPARLGCGLEAFARGITLAIPPVDEQVYPEGCMPVIRRSLDASVLPALLACALLALVAGLLQLLLVLAVCCFADHVKKIKDMRSKMMIPYPYRRKLLCRCHTV